MTAPYFSQYLGTLDAASKHLSCQTGYIQLDDKIAVLHQLTFALALLQKQRKQAAFEAIAVLEKILPFQNNEGAFPAYLHTYPWAADGATLVKIAAVFAIILKYYARYLPATATLKWHQSFLLLKKYLLAKNFTATLVQCWLSLVLAFWEERLAEFPVEEYIVQHQAQFSSDDWGWQLAFLQLAASVAPASEPYRAIIHL